MPYYRTYLTDILLSQYSLFFSLCLIVPLKPMPSHVESSDECYTFVQLTSTQFIIRLSFQYVESSKHHYIKTKNRQRPSLINYYNVA